MTSIRNQKNPPTGRWMTRKISIQCMEAGDKRTMIYLGCRANGRHTWRQGVWGISWDSQFNVDGYFPSERVSASKMAWQIGVGLRNFSILTVLRRDIDLGRTRKIWWMGVYYGNLARNWWNESQGAVQVMTSRDIWCRYCGLTILQGANRVISLGGPECVSNPTAISNYFRS